MASYLRPRRGKKATAIAQLTASAPLKRGEVFFEVPDGGTGTGAGRIKMGDGSTAYESLPYFLEPFDPDSATVGFTDAAAAEADPYTTNATHTNAIVPSANFKTIFTNLKQLLLNYNSQLTKLNNDLFNGIPVYSEAVYPISSNITTAPWTYTAPSNGILYLNLSLNASNAGIVGYISNAPVVYLQNVSTDSKGRRENVTIFMNKGDILNINSITNGSVITSTFFVPLK